MNANDIIIKIITNQSTMKAKKQKWKKTKDTNTMASRINIAEIFS